MISALQRFDNKSYQTQPKQKRNIFEMEVYVGLLVVILALWLIVRKRHLSQFKDLGIPGPEPSLLFGNILELYSKGPVKCHEEWVRKYGRVLGYFQGMKPCLLVTDPELLKTIFIKDFNKFINREAFNPIFHYDPNNKDGQSVLNLPGKKWKDVRSVMTPTFTAAKMKQMSPSMDSSIESMLNIMRERAKTGETFNVLDSYQRVTMDVITRTAFGVRTDVQTNSKSRLLAASALLFSTVYRDPILFVGLCWPFLERLCRKLQEIVLFFCNRGEQPNKQLRKGVVQVLKHRRSNPLENKNDILQLMIDTKIYSHDGDVEPEQLEAGNATIEEKLREQEESKKAYRTMTDAEIISSALTILLAGYETTSTALAFTTYLLGKYPEYQDQLFEEICGVVHNGQKLDYGTISKLQLLDKILNESLRVYPPVYLFSNRYAVESVQYGDLKILKGMLIHAPVYFMHHDPDLWSDPETFDPERFDSKPNQDGIKYLPFGVGPRNCLGMRLAQLEAKLVLAHVFYNFKVILDESQKENLGLILRLRTVAPKNGIQVKLVPRDHLEK